MFFPPLHDELEFLTGYRGRLAAAHDCRSVTELNAAIRKHSAAGCATSASGVRSSAARDRVDFVGTVAAALGYRQDSLLLGHTLWGISMAFRDSGQGLADGPGAISIEKMPMPRLRNALVGLCQSCIRRDLESTHLSFWRRDHQVPGRYRCADHGDVLRFVDCPPLLTQAPHEVMGRARLPNEQAIMYGDTSASAAITADLLEAFLGGARVRPSREARRALCEQAKSYLAVNSASGATAKLSTIFTRVVPRPWISDLLPRMNFREGALALVQNVIEQDGLSRSACAYALVAGQVCESFEEAASVLGLDAQ